MGHALLLGQDASLGLVKPIRAVLAAVLAAVATLEQILGRKDDVPLWRVVEIVWFELRTFVIGIHGAHVAQRNNRKRIGFKLLGRCP